MQRTLALTALAMGAGVYAQQAGTSTPETHPSMPYSKCTAPGSCQQQSTSIVLDSNWRWLHNVGGYTNCYSGNTWSSQYCPDGTTCAKNCALDGADYQGTYGIAASGGSLGLTLKTGSNVGSRVYLMSADNTNYEMFKLKNREFTFDVDVSGLGCGLNGALYFVSMDADGGLSKYPGNKAGAKYGTGYCDAQCPQDLKFINGVANSAGWKPSSGDPNSGSGTRGSCCNEMDIWEANSISTAYTPHVCSPAGQTACTSDQSCGNGNYRQQGYCDKDGCDYNSYRLGNHSFYGPGQIVNTKSKFTVVTQFITADGTDTGDLSSIRRIYIQNGKVIQNSNTNVAGITTTNAISDTFCANQKKTFGDPNTFSTKGGLKAFGNAMANGMVLVMSIWDDYTAQMLWLDAPYPASASPSAPGVSRGTCASDSGKPGVVESTAGGSKVIFSNIKFGPLKSTYAS